jgi:hypothetical protein
MNATDDMTERPDAASHRRPRRRRTVRPGRSVLDRQRVAVGASSTCCPDDGQHTTVRDQHVRSTGHQALAIRDLGLLRTPPQTFGFGRAMQEVLPRSELRRRGRGFVIVGLGMSRHGPGVREDLGRSPWWKQRQPIEKVSQRDTFPLVGATLVAHARNCPRSAGSSPTIQRNTAGTRCRLVPTSARRRTRPSRGDLPGCEDSADVDSHPQPAG